MSTNMSVGSFNNVQTLVPVFSGEDYDYWSLQMRTLFVSQDLWELVDGGYDAPESLEALVTRPMNRQNDHADQKENTVKDATALLFIHQGVCKSIFPDISEARCSKQAWDILKKKFQLPSKKIPHELGSTTIRMSFVLYMCIKEGEISKLKQIISQDVLIKERTCSENTALHVAVQYKRIDFVQEIFNLCPLLVLEQNLKGDMALHLAARTGKQDIVKFLIENSNLEIGGERVDKKLVRMANERMDTALHDAVRNHHLEVVKLLTEADPEFEYFPNANEETPLYLAVEDQLYDVVKQILEVCPSSAHSGPKGVTALHVAVTNNHSGMTELLLKIKPSLINQTDSKGQTALHYAAWRNVPERVTQLLEFDRSIAFISTEYGITPLHIASRFGSLSSMKEIIRLCPDSVEALTNEGNSFIHFAIIYKQYKVIEWILELDNMIGDLVNVTNKDGNTALHLAALSENYMNAKKLIEIKTTNERIMNNDRRTAMDIFFSYGNPLIHCIFKQGGGASNRQKRFIIRKHLQDKPWSQKRVQEMKEMSNIGLIASTLIATVTFTAGITLPGGFKGHGEDEGHAVLTRETAFKAFVVFNTIAMFLSLYTVFLHFSMKFMRRRTIGRLQGQAHLFTLFAIVAVVLAFLTGSYAVLSNSVGLVVAVCVICFIFFIYVFGTALEMILPYD